MRFVAAGTYDGRMNRDGGEDKQRGRKKGESVWMGVATGVLVLFRPPAQLSL
jgi:hypothetical protein